MELSLKKVGNSQGLILPKEVVARLRAKLNDKVYLTETPNGYEITPYDPTFALQMDLAERIMHDNKDVLKKLAE